MNRFSVNLLVAALAIGSILAFSGCIGQDEEDASSKKAASVTVAGSTTVMPLVEACAEEFNKIQNEVRVSVTGGGSGVGIKNVAGGTADVAMASREVKPDEIASYGDSFREFLVAYDAIAIVVSQRIYDAGITDLSREEVRAIYSGDITNWKDLVGPDAGIYVAAREVGSGTRDTFNEMVLGSEKAETPGVTTYHGSNAEVKTAVTGSDKAIGYVGMNYVQRGGHAHSRDDQGRLLPAVEGPEPLHLRRSEPRRRNVHRLRPERGGAEDRGGGRIRFDPLNRKNNISEVGRWCVKRQRGTFFLIANSAFAGEYLLFVK